MECTIKFKIAKRNGEYPEVLGLTSKQLLLVIGNKVTSGYFHCNRHFYTDSIHYQPINMISHADYNHGNVTPWCYLDEVTVPPYD